LTFIDFTFVLERSKDFFSKIDSFERFQGAGCENFVHFSFSISIDALTVKATYFLHILLKCLLKGFGKIHARKSRHLRDKANSNFDVLERFFQERKNTTQTNLE
jgi:hypothetical protein